jgi:hypothetical protein
MLHLGKLWSLIQAKKRFVVDKRASLLVQGDSDEEKKFDNVATRLQSSITKIPKKKKR